MKYAIIEIAPQNVSLSVAEGEKSFDILFREKQPFFTVALTEEGTLCDRDAERIRALVNGLKEKCRTAGAEKCFVISCPDEENSGICQAMAAELKRFGVNVNFLTEAERVRCELAANECYRAFERAVLVDAGKEELRFYDLTKDGRNALISLNAGIKRINRKFVKGSRIGKAEAKEIKKYVRKKMKKADIAGDGAFATAVLSGENFRAVYNAFQAGEQDSHKVGEKRIGREEFKKYCRRFLKESDDLSVMKDRPEEADSLKISAAILRAALSYLKPANILVSDYGMKEGYAVLAAGGESRGVETPLVKDQTLSVKCETERNEAPVYGMNALTAMPEFRSGTVNSEA